MLTNTYMLLIHLGTGLVWTIDQKEKGNGWPQFYKLDPEGWRKWGEGGSLTLETAGSDFSTCGSWDNHYLHVILGRIPSIAHLILIPQFLHGSHDCVKRYKVLCICRFIPLSWLFSQLNLSSLLMCSCAKLKKYLDNCNGSHGRMRFHAIQTNHRKSSCTLQQ